MAADHVAVNVAGEHTLARHGETLDPQVAGGGAEPFLTSGFEDVVILHCHSALDVTVEVVGEGVLHHKYLLRQRRYITVGNVDGQAVDGHLGGLDGRCARIPDKYVDRQDTAAVERGTAVGDVALETVGELLFVDHDDRSMGDGIGQGIYHLDAGIVEIAVEVGHDETVAFGTNRQRIGQGRRFRHVDAGGVKQGELILQTHVAVLGIAYHMALLCPQDGKVLGVLRRTVTDNLNLVRLARANAKVAAGQTVAVTVHVDSLEIHLARTVGLLVDHSHHAVLTRTAHEKVNGM